MYSVRHVQTGVQRSVPAITTKPAPAVRFVSRRSRIAPETSAHVFIRTEKSRGPQTLRLGGDREKNEPGLNVTSSHVVRKSAGVVVCSFCCMGGVSISLLGQGVTAADGG